MYTEPELRSISVNKNKKVKDKQLKNKKCWKKEKNKTSSIIFKIMFHLIIEHCIEIFK